jgi:hypothetical protein
MAPWDPSYPVPPNLLDLVRANAWAPPNLPLFRPAPSQFAGMADDQRQPSTLGASGANNARSAPFSDWPLAPTTASSTGANSSGIPPGSFPEHDDNNPHSAYAARLLEDAKRSHDFALWAFGSPSARRAPNVFAEGPYETASQFSGPGRTPLGAGARSENMTTPASAVPVSYQTDRAKTPWWGVSPGDIWWDQYRKGMTGLYNFLRSGLGGGGGRRRKSEEECEEQYREDGDICRARHSRTCWEQAAVRYKNCLHGDQIPPLGFGGR